MTGPFESLSSSDTLGVGIVARRANYVMIDVLHVHIEHSVSVVSLDSISYCQLVTCHVLHVMTAVEGDVVALFICASILNSNQHGVPTEFPFTAARALGISYALDFPLFGPAKREGEKKSQHTCECMSIYLYGFILI